MMRKIAKVLAWTAGVAVGLPVAAYLVWLAGNLCDEDMNATVSRIVSAQPADPDPKGNAYFDVIGLDAPDNQDAHAFGLERFKAFLAADRASPGQVESGAAPTRKLAIKPSDLPCRQAENCLAEVAADTVSVKHLLSAEGILLRRLDGVLDTPYQEPYRQRTYWSDRFSFSAYVTASSLARARFALLAQEGHHQQALQDWGRLTEFATRQLAGSRSLIAKAVAIRMLHQQHLLLAAYFGKYPDAARANGPMIRPFLRPLSPTERALTPALESEIALLANSHIDDTAGVRRMIGPEDPARNAPIVDALLEPLFKPIATLNEAADRISAWTHLETLDGEAYRDALATLAAQQMQANEVTWRYRNPVGQWLLVPAVDIYSDFFYLRDTLVAERRLLAWGLGLLTDGPCDAEAIQKAISHHPELAHPYTGEAPQWTNGKRTLSYALPVGMSRQRGLDPIELSVPGTCH